MTASARGIPALAIRFTGRIRDLDVQSRHLLLDRLRTPDELIEKQTAAIIREVRREGDRALRRFALEHDDAAMASFEIGIDTCRRALDALDPSLRRALERSRDNIATAHRAFAPSPMAVQTEPGVTVGRRPDPVDSAGVYAPGGRAAYPSSLLMGAITARIAGVKRIVVCSPPAPDGFPADIVLAAAALAGVDQVFAVGGAGAIAAMALGTASIPAVDIVVGPGNAYVAEAKRQLSSFVGTDAPAGPSELLIIADASATPDVVAREALAQAEHDPRAAVVILCTGARVASALTVAIARLLPEQQRFAIIAESLANNGAVLIAEDIEECLAFAARYAPEHLLLAVEPARQDELLSRVRNAGTVFLGEQSSVAFGDYMTGANHVLPTSGHARLRSGLSPMDFVRWTTWQRVEERAASSLAGDVAIFADAEGLPAHAAAARQWAS